MNKDKHPEHRRLFYRHLMLWYRLHLLPPSHCLISIGKQRTIVKRFVFFRYDERSKFPNSLHALKKENRTSRPLGLAYAPLILIWFWQLLLRRLHQAKPDKINDKHGSSLPSINEYFGLLLYFSSKSPFAQLFSFAAEILDRGCNGICAEIRKRLSIWNRLRVWSCFSAFSAAASTRQF